MAQEASLFLRGEASSTDNHTGTVWFKELAVPDSIFNFSLAQATFAPGANHLGHEDATTGEKLFASV